MLTRRLEAYCHWKTLKEPHWGNVDFPPIDYQKLRYYAAPSRPIPKKWEEVDPEILATFDKLGIPLGEQKQLAGVAVDAVLDSVSVGTTFQKELEKQGIIFSSFSQAVQRHPDLVQRYMGKVVPMKDNFFSALNAALFSDGSFCYIPKGVRCPLPLSTYFRINAAQTGQFERTLIIAEEGASLDYLEGCTAPIRPENQLHAAVVEIHAKARASVHYATVQNWYPGDKQGKGGIYNFVVKRGLCAGEHAKIAWVQLETGSAITWKYPSCLLKGAHSVGEFYSVAVTKNRQQADTGSKMHHLAPHTRSKIISKGIAAGESHNSYRGLVQLSPRAKNAHHFTQCDSLLIGPKSAAYTFPTLEGQNHTATLHHEATTSAIDEAQLFYCQQRGIQPESAHALIATGFCQEVLAKLPLEFAMEAEKLLQLTLEGSVG